MSWIMRSSTTATSEPLGLNGANRSLSMNPGLVHVRKRGAHRAVEPLDVADLDDHALLARELEERIGFFERRRDRLLDEDVLAAARSRPGLLRSALKSAPRRLQPRRLTSSMSVQEAYALDPQNSVSTSARAPGRDVHAIRLHPDSGKVVQKTFAVEIKGCPTPTTPTRGGAQALRITTPRSLASTKLTRSCTSGRRLDLGRGALKWPGTR